MKNVENIAPDEAAKFKSILENRFPWIGADAPTGNVLQSIINLHEDLARRARGADTEVVCNCKPCVACQGEGTKFDNDPTPCVPCRGTGKFTGDCSVPGHDREPGWEEELEFRLPEELGLSPLDVIQLRDRKAVCDETGQPLMYVDGVA